MAAECYDIYETLKNEEDDYSAVKTKMNDYFVPKYNIEFERYIFRQASQKEGENLDQFCTRLKQLSVNCDFTEGTVENEVKTQMIHGCTSKSLRKRACQNSWT